MLFGNIPKGMICSGEPLSSKFAFLFLGILICVTGVVFVFIKGDWIWIVRKLFLV